MAEQLSEKIKEAIHLYYIHRDRQSVEKWNKAEDLERIFEAAREEGWQTEAVAGNFWFSRKVTLGTHVIEVNEKNFPEGGKSNLAMKGEPFGAVAIIAEALRKTGREPLIIKDEGDVNAYADLLRDNGQGG